MLAVNELQSQVTTIDECSWSDMKQEGVKTLKHDEMQYLDLIQYILDNGTKKEDRTGKIERSYDKACCGKMLLWFIIKDSGHVNDNNHFI